MKGTILFGSPRHSGNTAALLRVFLQECEVLGVQTRCISVYERDIRPCLGCMACQEELEGFGCVQKDEVEAIFAHLEQSDVLLFATPIYAWYCTAPMKALMDRVIYAGNKKYGTKRGASLLAGKGVASLVTCGYPQEKGADLWEAGLKRWCKHGEMTYLGQLCGRDRGRAHPFLDQEKVAAAQNFARTLHQGWMEGSV